MVTFGFFGGIFSAFSIASACRLAFSNFFFFSLSSSLALTRLSSCACFNAIFLASFLALISARSVCVGLNDLIR